MKNGRLEYEINFSRRKLRNDIAERLRETYRRHIPYDECLKIAEEAIARMQEGSNRAVYNALLQSCIRRAVSQISRGSQEGSLEQYI